MKVEQRSIIFRVSDLIAIDFSANIIELRFTRSQGKPGIDRKKNDFYDANRDYLGIRCFLIEGRKCYVI